MDRKTTFATIIVLALLCAGLYWVTRPEGEATRPPAQQVDAGTTESDAGGTPDAEAEPTGFVDETAEGRDVRLMRDEAPVKGAGIVAGAPGSYPPELGESGDDGVFRIEHAATETFSGEKVGWVEMYAFDQEHAAWATIDLTEADTPDIELVRAHDLNVTVVRPSGVPASGATVRLSRQAVGLVVLESIADSEGRTTFGPVPPGTYVVTAEVPGFLTSVETVEVASQEAEAILEVLPGARVTGIVLGATGRPVSDAFVAIYVDEGELRGVPRAIVSTDSEGKFEVSGIVPGPTWALASGPGGAPARSETIDTREGADSLEVRLKPALTLQVRVVTESDEPVRGATVTWSDDATSANSAVLTDDSGQASFDSVAPGATLLATLHGWESRRHKVTSEDSGALVELRLTRGAPPQRVRIDGLPDDVTSISVVTSDGTACGVNSIDERDFWVTGCGKGEATLTVVSEAAGTAVVKLALSDGAKAVLPERRPFKVRVNVKEPGTVPTADWSDGSAWRRFSLTQTDEQVWEGVAQLYPGSYMTRAQAPGHASEESSIRLGAQGAETAVELEELVRHELLILDVRRSPITGARVEVWDGSKRVRVARSAGQLPVVVERPAGDGWYILAIDPQRGERRMSLDAPRLEVELTQPVGSVTSPGRLTPRQLSGKAGIRFARDGEAWLIDPVPGSAAAKVLRRGDRYVTARSVGTSAEIVLERGRSTETIQVPLEAGQ